MDQIALAALLEVLALGGNDAKAAFARYLEWPLYDAIDSKLLSNAGTPKAELRPKARRAGLNCVDDSDTFKADYIDQLRKKAERGTLLSSFDSDEDGADPVTYLIGSVLYLRISDFASRRAVDEFVDVVDTAHTRIDQRQTTPDEWKDRVQRVMQTRIRIHWSPKEDLPTTVQTACVQTWSNLDEGWEHKTALQDQTATAANFAHEELTSFISEIERRLGSEIFSMADDIGRKTRVLNHTRLSAERKISNRLQQLLLSPLNADELQQAFGLPSKDAAAARLSRYNKSRSRLLQVLVDGQEIHL